MLKSLLMAFAAALVMISFLGTARADYATTPQPYPQPYPNQPYYPNQPSYPPVYGSYPYPAPQPGYYPAPAYPNSYYTVTCYAQGMANGALFYGMSYNVYYATQWALYACQSSGQYCQITVCR